MPSADVLYTFQIRHELAQIATQTARQNIDERNRMQQYKHARHAQQNATHIHNRNIAHMQRTKRK